MKTSINAKGRSLARSARHRWEIPLVVFSVFLTALFYVLSFSLSVLASEDNLAVEFLRMLFNIPKTMSAVVLQWGSFMIFIFLLYNTVLLVYYNLSYEGMCYSRSVKLPESRYKVLNELYLNLAEKAGIENPPPVFISSEDKPRTIIGIPVCSIHAICIDDDIVRSAMESGDSREVEYTLLRKLAAISLGHCSFSFQFLTLCLKYIPLLRGFLYRSMCYSVDRFVSLVLGSDFIIRNIVETSYNLDSCEDDAEAFAELRRSGISKDERFASSAENLADSTPVPIFRIEALLNGSRSGRLL